MLPLFNLHYIWSCSYGKLRNTLSIVPLVHINLKASLKPAEQGDCILLVAVNFPITAVFAVFAPVFYKRLHIAYRITQKQAYLMGKTFSFRHAVP